MDYNDDEDLITDDYEIVGLPSGLVIDLKSHEFKILNRNKFLKWGGYDIGFTFDDIDTPRIYQLIRSKFI